jgi:hypothetical protein
MLLNQLLFSLLGNTRFKCTTQMIAPDQMLNNFNNYHPTRTSCASASVRKKMSPAASRRPARASSSPVDMRRRRASAMSRTMVYFGTSRRAGTPGPPTSAAGQGQFRPRPGVRRYAESQPALAAMLVAGFLRGTSAPVAPVAAHGTARRLSSLLVDGGPAARAPGPSL